MRGKLEITQGTQEQLGAWLEMSETLARVGRMEGIRQAEASELVTALEIGKSDLGFEASCEEMDRIGDSGTGPGGCDRRTQPPAFELDAAFNARVVNR